MAREIMASAMRTLSSQFSHCARHNFPRHKTPNPLKPPATQATLVLKHFPFKQCTFFSRTLLSFVSYFILHIFYRLVLFCFVLFCFCFCLVWVTLPDAEPSIARNLPDQNAAFKRCVTPPYTPPPPNIYAPVSKC